METVLKSYEMARTDAVTAAVHSVVELSFSLHVETDPPHLTEISARVEASDGRSFEVPGFWRGGDRWSVRLAPRSTGGTR